jgi:hypothetical protein
LRTTRPAIVTATIALSILFLSGCAGLIGPDRDADGRVTGTTEINSIELVNGDCFTFVDGTSNARASVTPCESTHTHIVIGSGDLTAAAIDEAGGLQNAVSASCAEGFEVYKAAAAEGTKTAQEFVVAEVERDGKPVTAYLCVATDAPASAAG